MKNFSKTVLRTVALRATALRVNLLLIILLFVFLQASSFAVGDTNTAISTSQKESSLVSDIDNSVSPAEDFYQYANGTWLKNNPIPEEYSTWGTITILRLQTLEKLYKIMENAASDHNTNTSSVRYKVGAFYATGMNEAKIEKDGINPLKDELTKIDSVEKLEDLTSVVAHMHRYTASPLFYLIAVPDYENSNFMIAYISQGGLGLPERDYYFNKDKAFQETREKYIKYITNIFKLMGFKEKEALNSAKTVMDIETSLAGASKTNVQMRDSKANSNKISFNELKKLAPNFNWDIYFKNTGVKNTGLNKNIKINVGQPNFLKEMSKVFISYPIESWKIYLKWNLINENADYLSSDFVNEKFDFYSKHLKGAKKIQPRWKRVVNATSDILGEAVGELFAKEYFKPQAKKKAFDMTHNIIKAFGERIKNLEWMSEKTKLQALKKLNKIVVKIGYPDKWKDFSSLRVKKDFYVLNVMRARDFWFCRMIKKIGKPIDKTEWEYIYPQMVNAMYYTPNNEIVFPAAVLQPPFFDFKADDAANYGAIGVGIGHEITHGFDDEGRHYDSDGNLYDWWTKENEQNFIKRAKVLVKQYSTCIPMDNLHINGELTLGENIADLGGLIIALQGFKMTKEFKKSGSINGFTPIQRFFLSYANIWKCNTKPETSRLLIKTDVHSPPKYRTNIPLSNIEDFFNAFNVKSGDKMYRDKKDRAEIW